MKWRFHISNQKPDVGHGRGDGCMVLIPTLSSNRNMYLCNQFSCTPILPPPFLPNPTTLASLPGHRFLIELALVPIVQCWFQRHQKLDSLFTRALMKTQYRTPAEELHHYKTSQRPQSTRRALEGTVPRAAFLTAPFTKASNSTAM